MNASCNPAYNVLNYKNIIFFRLTQPPKMRITEEKVSASLRDMHISSEFKPHNCCVSSAISEMDVSNFLGSVM